MGGMMWIGAGLGLVAMLLLLAGLALLVVWLWQKVRDSGQPSTRQSAPDGPLPSRSTGRSCSGRWSSATRSRRSTSS